MNQNVETLIDDLTDALIYMRINLEKVEVHLQELTNKVEEERAAPAYPKTITPQMRKVLNHLRTKGSITALEAMGVYNIYRLAARVKELRLAGYDINTDRRRDHNGKQYARYTLAGV